MTLVYRTWKLPLWAKGFLVLIAVSAIAAAFYKLNIFANDHGTLVGVLTLQTGFAAYLVSVSRHEHVERLIPVVRRIFSVVADDDNGLHDFVESTSFITLQLPQRLAIYVLISDILMCPFILIQSVYIQVWIMTMTFVCMFWLLFAVLLLRVELFEKWLSVQMNKLQAFLKKHGQDVWILLFILGLAFAASNWLKKQGESKRRNLNPGEFREGEKSIS